MGSTKDAIENGDNPRLVFVLAIEGYVTVLTSHPSTAAVVTAWSGTGYTAAQTGLEPPGEITQSLSPFHPSIESETATFVIHGGETDTFAEDVFAKDKSAGGHARMDASVDANDTTISVADTGDFSGSVTAWIGTERFTATDGTGEFTSATRGTPAPFAIDGGSTFGRAHRVTQVAGTPIYYPHVTDFPRKWIGKWVGCWVHRVVGGVLDVKAQAQLIFAGKIADIRDGVSGGKDVTVLDCTDTRDVIKSAVLMGDQFTCAPQEGINLVAGEVVNIQSTEWNRGVSNPISKEVTLTVGSAQYGSTHIPAGRVTALDIINGISLFVNDAVAAADLVGTWGVSRTGDERFRIGFSSSTTVSLVNIRLKTSPALGGMIGFDTENPTGWEGDTIQIPYWENRKITGAGTLQVDLYSTFQRAHSFVIPQYTDFTVPFPMEAPSGTWIDQQADLPDQFAFTTDPDTTSGNWGFLTYGGRTALAKRTSDILFDLYVFPELDDIEIFAPQLVHICTV